MKHWIRGLIVAALTLLLAACASGGPLVTPGRTTAGGNLSIEAGMDLVAPAQDLLKEAGASYEVEISLGEEANTLIDIAESNECDQIIIGATGQSGLGSILIGSVSREVARHSRLPVTIVKLPEVAEADDNSAEDADS